MSKKLSLCMIVKNEEKHLLDCLSSVNTVVDEIIVVDTGSTDRTIQIAESASAKIFHFDWIDDFSAARNFALSKCSGNLILYMDADEILNASSFKTIEQIKNSTDTAAYLCTVVSVDRNNSRDNSMQYARLFPNINGIKFLGKVHEQIAPSLKEKEISVLQSDVVITHFGYDVSEDLKREKAKRNINLLRQEYSNSNSAYYAFQLANAYSILEDTTNAEIYYLAAGNSNDLDTSHRAHCFASLALIYHNTFRAIEAESRIIQAIKFDNKSPFIYLLASKIALRNGNMKSADERCLRAYQINQELKRKSAFNSISIITDDEEVICFGIMIALQTNNHVKIRYFEKELLSLYNGSSLDLVKKLIRKKSFEHEDIHALSEIVNKNNLNFFLTMIGTNPYIEQMIELVKSLQLKFPLDADITKLLANLLDQNGNTEQAIILLEEVLFKFENDIASYFYLITFYLKKGQLTKIEQIINAVKCKFSNIPDVIKRLDIIQNKLSSFINLS